MGIDPDDDRGRATFDQRGGDRDVKGVHGDVHALLSAGILQKTEDGLITFPFDAVHVDIILHAA